MGKHIRALKEATVNTVIGYIVSLISYVYLFEITVTTTLIMTGYFTGASMLRSYLVRLWFEYRANKKKGGE